jgi:hypothetical protein
MQWPCHGPKQSFRSLVLSNLETIHNFASCGIYSIDGISPFRFWDGELREKRRHPEAGEARRGISQLQLALTRNTTRKVTENALLERESD